ncbi:MAG: PHB depolymerase family esterase [Phycisphaerales bacterium]|nr:PHB depolymerase family esterase [Phycisphaerales bacterium]
MRLLATIVVCLLAVASANAQNINFPHDGLDRQYRIHIPDQLSESPALVLALHGYSGNNNDMINNYGWTELADERGFIVACPNGTQDQWGNRFWDVDYDFHQNLDIDDDGFLSALALHLQNLYGLDPNRVFVTGFSNGAEMCFQLACRESESFAAFAPIVGMMLDPLFTNCEPDVLRPILSLNGTDDNVTLFDGDMNNSGGWGAYHSIPDTMALWANILGTTGFERTYLPDTDPNDGSTVRLDVYSSSQHGLELWYYLVIGGGHDWPGQWGNMDINAAVEVWNFFDGLSDEPCTPGDFNGDAVVNVTDLLLVISGWENPYNVTDLLTVIGAWGSTCSFSGACCLSDGSCNYIDSNACEEAGGYWSGASTSCTVSNCPQLGACCWEDGTCDVLLSNLCTDGGGSFRGADTNCSSVDCSAEFNDECIDAMVVTNGSIPFTTLEATTSSDAYNDSQCSGTYLGEMHADIWFSYAATCTGTLSVSTCNTATFDTDLVVYQGTCSNLIQIACNGDDDDNCGGYTSQLNVDVTSGEQYLIRLGGWESGNSGTGTLAIDCEDGE